MAEEGLLSTTALHTERPIVGWIFEYERKALDRAMHLQGIGLYYVSNALARLLGAIGIQLDTVTQDVSPGSDRFKCHSITDARIKRRRLIYREPEEISDLAGFAYGEGVEAEAALARKTHWFSYEC